jgi:hypothetical protein
VYQSLVTTLAVRAIAERAGCEPIVTDLLVGFKYVGQAVLNRARELGAAPDDPSLLAFAAEESHGYLDTPQLRDKDAMAGALYLAKLHERLAPSGRTLVDYLDAIYADVGEIGDRGRSIVMLGSAGIRRIRSVMEDLRSQPWHEIAGLAVEQSSDYWNEEEWGAIGSSTEREARNILTFSFAGGRLTLRPSGTEPKLKFYVSTTQPGPGGVGAQVWADQISDWVYTDILRLLGHTLAPQYVSLPDVIPLDSKLEMQDGLVPEVRRLLFEEGRSPELAADWVRERIKGLVPGESASQIAARVLRASGQQWAKDEVTVLEEVLEHLDANRA